MRKPKRRIGEVTDWDVERLDGDLRSTDKFYDEEDAVACRRCTQKDTVDEWCIIASQMEKEILRRYDVLKKYGKSILEEEVAGKL